MSSCQIVGEVVEGRKNTFHKNIQVEQKIPGQLYSLFFCSASYFIHFSKIYNTLEKKKQS